MSNASSVSLCVGCGKDLTDCSKTRKKLGDDSQASDQATRISVLSAWRELAAKLIYRNVVVWMDLS